MLKKCCGTVGRHLNTDIDGLHNDDVSLWFLVLFIWHGRKLHCSFFKHNSVKCRLIYTVVLEIQVVKLYIITCTNNNERSTVKKPRITNTYHAAVNYWYKAKQQTSGHCCWFVSLEQLDILCKYSWVSSPNLTPFFFFLQLFWQSCGKWSACPETKPRGQSSQPKPYTGWGQGEVGALQPGRMTHPWCTQICTYFSGWR